MIVHNYHDLRPSRCEIAHNFELISEEPTTQRLRRLPQAYNEIVKKEVKCRLQVGIITPVESAWTPLIELATIKNRSPRFCIDFSKVKCRDEKGQMTCAMCRRNICRFARQ